MAAAWPTPGTGLESSLITVPGGALVHVVSAGPASGAPVLCVHGWGIHSYLWRKTLPALAAAGYRVHAIDLPGHGQSSLPAAGALTLDALTSHLVAVLDALAIPRVAVLAQSMGARVALELARRCPDRVTCLALFGAVGLGEAPALTPLASRLPRPQTLPTTVFLRRWMVDIAKRFAYGSRGSFTDDDVDIYWRAAQRPGVIPALWQALAEFDWRVLDAAVLGGIAVPTLVIFGTRDRTVRPVGVESRVAAMPAASLRWVQDAGHVVCEEAPDEVNPLLVEFLRAAR